MTKTLAITAIVLVTVVMGLGILAPALQQIEAREAGSAIKIHCANHLAPPDVGFCAEQLCTAIGGIPGTLHFIDVDGDDEHDDKELLLCLKSLPEPPETSEPPRKG